MTKRIDIVLFLLLAAMLLVGCSHRNDPTEPLTTTKNEITLKTGVTSRIKRIAGIDSNSDLQEKALKIDAYYNGTDTKHINGTKLVYDTDHWRFDDGSGNELHYYWPFEGSKTSSGDDASTLDFVGFCPFTKPAYIGAPTYAHATGVSFTCDMSTYMTPASQTSMQEFLIAVSNSQTLANQEAHNGVPMEFKHPFALIKFVIAEGSGTAVTVDSIGISDLYTTATCTYDGTDLTWGSHDDAAAMSQDGLNLRVDGTTETRPFMVIPKNYGTKTLTIKGTWTDWSNPLTKNLSAEVTLDWQPGYIYTYTLTVTKYALKVDITRYTEQW